jgi:hypothetical protein
VNGPSIVMAQVYRKQKFVLSYDVSMLICRILSMVFGGLYLSGLGTVALVSIVGMVFNTFIILWMFNFLKHEKLRQAEPPAST